MFALLITAYIGYHFLIYPFLISPLRHVPRAHWSVPVPYVGSCWILYQRYQSRNNAVTHEAHLKHGPIVRLGDNEISVNCYEGGIKSIYAGGWLKHEWYPRQFANFGVMNMFSTVGHNPHAQKKRIMANIYSKSFLQSSPQVQANSQRLLKDRFLPLIEALANSGEEADIHEINNAFTMDFMTAYQFGISQSTNFTQNAEVRKKYLHLYHSRRDWQFISSEIPPFFRKMLQRLGVSLYPAFIHKANEWLEDWSKSMCDAADQYLRSLEGSSTNAGDEPLVFKQFKTGLLSLRQKDPTAGLEVHPHLDEGMNFTRGLTSSNKIIPDEHTTLLEVYSDMVDQLAAGHETSGLALTYLYYELAKHPEIQDRLHAGLTSLSPQITWPPSDASASLNLPSTKSIDSLPYLHATIMETLRLHAPIPGMQPRITPSTPGGVSLGPPGTKHHYTGLPANIRVSAMAYTLHKIPEVFPDPESFNPDRWLNSSEEHLTEMNRHFWAFGSGGRMCIGRHLAMQEIKLIVAAVFTNYRVEIAEGGDVGIEEVDAYTTRPRSGKLVVRMMRR
ncbi:hypothetical protein OHC33_000518 [Knufia fluminis]|uniref:Cytochrome P450 n=2 Tax=Knufia TaxID=430999 RepID=A0AAN8EQI3_9EURO|nr:hypothetical protein OHC33_000518 [Knufia fluminis]